MTSIIPFPPAVPFIGHVASIEKEVPLRSFSLLSKQYGEIYQLNLVGELLIVEHVLRRSFITALR